MLSNEPMTESDLPTSSNRSRFAKTKRRNPMTESASPIAADGGFGHMDDDESEEEQSATSGDEAVDHAEVDLNENLGEDFDDFEAGAEDEDFGDFDEGFENPPIPEYEPEETELSTPPVQPLPAAVSSYVSISSASIQTIFPPNASYETMLG